MPRRGRAARTQAAARRAVPHLALHAATSPALITHAQRRQSVRCRCTEQRLAPNPTNGARNGITCCATATLPRPWPLRARIRPPIPTQRPVRRAPPAGGRIVAHGRRPAYRGGVRVIAAAVGGPVDGAPAGGTPRAGYPSGRPRHCPTGQQAAAARGRAGQPAVRLPGPSFLIPFRLPAALRAVAERHPRAWSSNACVPPPPRCWRWPAPRAVWARRSAAAAGCRPGRAPCAPTRTCLRWCRAAIWPTTVVPGAGPTPPCCSTASHARHGFGPRDALRCARPPAGARSPPRSGRRPGGMAGPAARHRRRDARWRRTACGSRARPTGLGAWPLRRCPCGRRGARVAGRPPAPGRSTRCSSAAGSPSAPRGSARYATTAGAAWACAAAAPAGAASGHCARGARVRRCPRPPRVRAARTSGAVRAVDRRCAGRGCGGPPARATPAGPRRTAGAGPAWAGAGGAGLPCACRLWRAGARG